MVDFTSNAPGVSRARIVLEQKAPGVNLVSAPASSSSPSSSLRVTTSHTSMVVDGIRQVSDVGRNGGRHVELHS